MAELLDIANNISDTYAAIRRLQDEIVQLDPIPPSLESTKIMLERRRIKLETDYMEAAAHRHLEVCRYKLFIGNNSGRQPKAKSFANALIGLQNVFSLVYDSLLKGQPKQKGQLSAEAYTDTSFDFAFSTHQSLGVVLTLPAEAMVPLFGQTTIDEAMETVFKLLAARDPEDIAIYAKQLGLAPIRNLYKWVSDQAAAGVSAELQWKDRAANFEATIESSEFEHLKAIIEASSAEDVREIELAGTLVGIDTTSRSFHMTFDGIGEVKGKIDDAIGKSESVEVPHFYNARIRITTVISYALEKETKTYLLLSLD